MGTYFCGEERADGFPSSPVPFSSQMTLLKSRTCASKQTRVEMNVVVTLVEPRPRWSNLLGTVKSSQAPDATAWDAPPSQPRLRLFPSTYPHPPGKSPG